MNHPLRSLLYLLTGTVLLSTAASAAAPWDAKPGDWPYWRGPQMNGVSTETNLPAEWDPKGENVLWKRDDLGSRSTPVILNDKLYLILRDNPGTIMEGERVVCLNAKTGETIWENSFNVFLSDVPDTRVGWSAVTADPETGNVFALGVCGLFQCIDGETGKTIWSHSLSEEYGLLSTYGGRTNFPIVYDELVIISSVIIGWGEMAKPAHRFIAFDKRNGQAVWFNGTRLLPYDTTYSAPSLAVIDGQTQFIFGSGDGGIHSFQPRTGQSLWSYEVSHRGINTAPLVVDGVVYAGHSEENFDSTKMGALFAIPATKGGEITPKEEVWRQTGWFVGKSAPIMIDGRLYAIEDKAQLLIVDPKSGELLERKKLGTMQRSSPVYADGKLYICTANGRWYTLKPTKDGVEVLHRMRLRGESHGSIAVSNQRLYIPMTDALYCVGFENAQDATADPADVADVAEAEDQTPAHLQVVPVESLLRPGQKQPFQLRLYNKAGQYLGTVPPEQATFTLNGPGTITKSGVLQTSSIKGHEAVEVSASLKELKGTARVRVVPELPWNIDFDGGTIPETFVGVAYRHVPLDFDLYQSLTAKDPQAGQLYLYLSSVFTNSGRDGIKFDRATSRQTLTGFLRFLNLDRAVTNVDEAKEKLDASLELLKQEKVLASWNWSQDDFGIVFVAAKGDRTFDGNGVMVKITTIPKGTRSQGWMGQPDLKNYVIQADIMGAIKQDKLPDMGLIAQRYTFDMMGALQQLQIRTWPPQLRMAKSVPFKWEPNTWYTMKFQASVEGKEAVLRGKVWKKGEQEPSDWLIEARDPRPNTQGSPGTFGNAKDAEIFYDNIQVYPIDS